MSVVEKIKQKAKNGLDVWQETVEIASGGLLEKHTSRELSEKVDEIREQKIWVKFDDVLKILSGYYLIGKDLFSFEQIHGVFESRGFAVIDKQKLQELADLIENRPEIFTLEDMEKEQKWFEKIKKFVELFGLEKEEEKRRPKK